MEIRAGFIRDDEGVWHNLDLVEKIEVCDTVHKKYIVTAMVGDYRMTLSQRYESEDDAEAALDNLFGVE